MKKTTNKNDLDTVLLWKISAAIFIGLGVAYSIGYVAHVIYKIL